MIVDATSSAATARARLWNLLLGGNEAYEIERALFERLRGVAPDIARLAHAERGFVDRFWRFVTGVRGVRQIVHVGAPLPVGHPPHRRLAEPGRVVYVEPDELLFRKGLAYLADRNVSIVHHEPLDVAEMVDVVGGLDWDEPIAVIAPDFLPWLDTFTARAWVADIAQQLAPGSFLAATHLYDPGSPDLVVLIKQLIQILDGHVGAGWFRRRGAIENLFPDLPLETPGVSLAMDWWPNGPRLDDLSPCEQLLAAAVATIPRSP